jgi:hypothetical protein
LPGQRMIDQLYTRSGLASIGRLMLSVYNAVNS